MKLPLLRPLNHRRIKSGDNDTGSFGLDLDEDLFSSQTPNPDATSVNITSPYIYLYSNSEDDTDIDLFDASSERKPPDNLKRFDSETSLLV